MISAGERAAAAEDDGSGMDFRDTVVVAHAHTVGVTAAVLQDGGD
jgi:hypothetical protein